jgi:hypothetical protein
MIIVLEGPDGAGKTTLAQRLVTEYVAARWSVRLLRKGPIKQDVFTEYLRPLDDLIGKPSNTVWILDRWHVGELIYGPLLRGRSQLTLRQAAYIEMVMQSFGCAFLHVSQPTSVLQERWDLRPDGLIKREWLVEVNAKYDTYVWTHHHWNSLSDSVEFGDHTLFQHPSPLPGRYIGPTKPRVLLLGDKRNIGTYTWPFVPARATSGYWLMGALLAADVDYMNVGLINASELSPDDLSTLWNTLEGPPVVTLGRYAQRAWRDTGERPANHLDHPQYMRRFHYQKFEDYGRTIKEVMNG